MTASILAGCGSGGSGGSGGQGSGDSATGGNGTETTSAAAADANEDGGLYYYSDGQRIPLTPSTKEIAVRPGTGISADRATDALAGDRALIAAPGAKEIGRTGFFLMGLKPETPEGEVQPLTERLASTSSVGFVSPVFEFPDAKMIVPDEIILKFKDDAPPVLISRAISSYEVLKKGNWGKNSFLLRVKVSSGVKVLQAANALHAHPWIEYSHPNFIRLLQRAPRLPPERKEKQDPQPGGPSRGTRGPLKIEPAQEALPLENPLAPSPSTIGPFSTGPPSWQAILDEGFEDFTSAGPVWTVTGDPKWGRTDYTHDTDADNYSVWCAKDGTNGLDPYTENYANDMSTNMTCGPFDLTDATYGQLRFRYWLQSQDDYDFLQYYLSTDGSHFYGDPSSRFQSSGGSGAWRSETAHLTDFAPAYLGDYPGDLTGHQVWLRFAFTSDVVTTAKGAFLDNVQILKATGDSQISNDTWSPRQWALQNVGQTGGNPGADISASEAWGITRGDPSIIVAVIDEGVDTHHEDLALVPGYDATGGNLGGEPSGDDAHGTNVAGIIAAVADNGKGVAGVAPGVKIMPVRIAYTSGEYWVTDDSQIADGIRWAADNGARVLNNSWGGGSSSTVISCAIEYARNTRGATLLFAAGNTNGGVIYPATLAEVIAVAATSPCDERKSPSSCDGEYWWGSSYGSQVDVAAPGVLHYSTDIMYGGGYSPGTSGNYYSHFNGTSSACPVASGVAALILSLNPALSPAEVQSILQNSADDLGPAGFDNEFGYGRVNAFASCSAPTPPVGLSASAASYQQIRLSWGGSLQGVAGFKIERKEGSGGTFSPIATLVGSITSCSDNGVNAETTYYYRVRAYGQDNSDYSNVAQATTPAAPTDDGGSDGDGDGGSGSDGDGGDGDDDDHDGGGGGGGGGGDGGFCFIATAAYGSYLAPEVRVLRRFRDEHLLTNPWGREFVRVYYRVSPPLARHISRHEGWRAATRWALTPLVYGLNYPFFPCLLGGVFLLLTCRRNRR
jgi:subtilisin family serine protease